MDSNRDYVKLELALEGISDNEFPIAALDRGSKAVNWAEPIKMDVLPLKNMVLFPSVLMPVTVSRPKSQKLVERAYKNETLVAVCCQKNKEVEDPTSQDLYDMGVAARIIQLIEMQAGVVVAILEAVQRIQVKEWVPSRMGLKAIVSSSVEYAPNEKDKEFLAIVSSLKDKAFEMLDKEENTSPEVRIMLRNLSNPYSTINYVCSSLSFSIVEKQQLLAVDSLQQRALEAIELINQALQLLQMKADIKSKTEEEINKEQREYYLHHQMETIQKELGGDASQELINDLEERASKKKWSQEVKKVFDKELKKLQRSNMHSPDYSSMQTYLEVMLDLPWNEYTEDNFDIRHAQQVLDEDHYGLDKVKERIIEYLAVLKQKGDMKSPIICLYGPPGVGKTSLGKSIARALGRKYARISLGGLHDEAEIRGHRRTYVGAMPGRILENLSKTKASNPVFVLDEIDKVGADYKGDPTSALLEVLDPEQNSTFHDNYLDIDYDLSKVLFIATANSLDTIPRPLLDRMELIEMTGYSIEEKQEIAKQYLVPKQLKENGLKASQMKVNKSVMAQLIDDYTRESGVRSLERQIATLCRKIVTRLQLGEEVPAAVSEADLVKYLGKPRFTRDMYEDNRYIGVVTGLAWTSVGGEILFIESSLSPAKQPTLTLTGNLGDVMKESATIALAYIKAHADQFDIPRKVIDTHAVHIHVPEGAIPKDGPSAGITMTTALVSAFTKRKVRPRVAMTGEMTLRGKVLPIGGVKEKMLAAKRAGITDLIFCKDNQKDVEEIPAMYTKGLRFHYVSDIQEVIDFALL